jgi:hypothetical protein
MYVWVFTGPASYVAACARQETDQMAGEGVCTWRDILLEEVAEAFAEDDPGRLRAELIQVAAVATQWVEAIDRRGVCTCTRQTRCEEDRSQNLCPVCRRLDIYQPCPHLGFGCGEAASTGDRCDCCTPEQWAAAAGLVRCNDQDEQPTDDPASLSMEAGL